MTIADERRRYALIARCCYCDADPNEPCRDDSRAPCDPHPERIEAASHRDRSDL